LDFGHDSQRAQTFEVRRAQNLRMHQAKAAVPLAVAAVKFFKIIEQHTVRFISDGMDRQLEAGREEGLKIARESLIEVRDIIQGVQVSAPFGNVKYALEVFEALDGFASRQAAAE